MVESNVIIYNNIRIAKSRGLIDKINVGHTLKGVLIIKTIFFNDLLGNILNLSADQHSGFEKPLKICLLK